MSRAAETPLSGAQLGRVLRFMRTLWSLDHRLDRYSKRMQKALGVTGPQRLVVRIAGRRPGLSAGELADVLHMDPSTLTGVLKRLDQQGLLERRPDAADRRRVLLFLTPRGRELDSLRGGTVEAVVRRTVGRLKPADLDAAERVLEAIGAELAR